MNSKYFVAVLFLAVGSKALTIEGSCPSVTGQANFDINQVVGYWFQIGAYDNIFTNGDCVNILYEKTNNTGVSISIDKLVDGTWQLVTGSAELSSTDGSGVFDTVLANEQLTTWIPSTNYNGYVILYTCTDNTDGTSDQYVWIFSRNLTLSPSSESAVNEFIATSGLVQEDSILKTRLDWSCFSRNL